jgi:arsenite methyltransferase
MTDDTRARDIKRMVSDGYGRIAREGGSCCGPAAEAGNLEGISFGENYRDLDGYEPAADLGLGCGLPTADAFIKPGETVLDLGSGAGNDAFIASTLVGETGRVIGLDMTADMVSRARANAGNLGRTNVEFVHGEIEAIPLPDDTVDLVVSNCVLNLVPDKPAAFAEIHRVLKPGGRFSISDVVLAGTLPPALAEASLLYLGCVAGAQQEAEYLATVAGAGLTDVAVVKRREIALPDGVVEDTLGAEGARDFAASGVKILSITVTGRKAAERG